MAEFQLLDMEIKKVMQWLGEGKQGVEHQRLLRSLRFDDIWRRQNLLAEQRDVVSQQVIRSFRAIENPNASKSTIDGYWQRFVDWFRSDSDSFFFGSRASLDPGRARSCTS